MIRRINLLPPELAERRRARQRVAAYAAAGIALVALLAGVFVFEDVRLGDERERLEAQEEENAGLRAQISQLNQFARIEAELAQKTRLLDDLTGEEVRWSVVLADVSLVIPSDVWLTSFSGSVQPGEAEERESVGSVQMAGTTFTHLDVARWLTRLAGVREFVFPYLAVSQKGELFGIGIVTFNSSVELAEEALRGRQEGAERRL